MKNLLLTSCLVGAALIVGCGGDKPAPKTQDQARVAPTSTITTSAAAPGPRTETSQVSISDEIMKLCNITAPTTTTSAPHFEFDSSQLADDDKSILAQVAKCFTTGPLKGRSMKLVGRADKRGETEYNMNLGAHRSGSVEQYLASLGVGEKQMLSTSRGSLDATGSDEPGYAKDRRVDIDLVH